MIVFDAFSTINTAIKCTTSSKTKQGRYEIDAVNLLYLVWRQLCKRDDYHASYEDRVI